MDALLHSLIECLSIKHTQKEKNLCLHWESNQCSLFRKSLAIAS